ncbi:PHP domain-containing protein [Patescibacteria group bacterium]
MKSLDIQKFYEHHKPFQVDLHMHSIHSDGGKTPDELVRMAEKMKLSVISITDHHTVAGYHEAKDTAKALNIGLLPGIEIDVDFKGSNYHLMGYGFDPYHKCLLKILKEKQQERKERAAKLIKNLQTNNKFDITLRQVESFGSKVIARYHIVKAIMDSPRNREKVWCEVNPHPNIFEIINYYMGKESGNYVPKEHFTLDEALSLMHDAGGIISVGHPGALQADCDLKFKMDDNLRDLIKLGVAGIEVYSPKHLQVEVKHYEEFVKQEGIIATGGSDYHGVEIPGVRWTDFVVPYQVYEDLEKVLILKKPHASK